MRKISKKITSPADFIGISGDGIISFGSGQPDLPPPKEIFRGLATRRLFSYGLIQGDEKLRMALSKEYLTAQAAHFVITNGASEALDLTFRAINKLFGSVSVLVCQPYYYSYPSLIELAGLKPIYTKLKKGRIDLDDFKEKIKEVKVVLINSPSNPTGRIEALSTLKEIEKLAANRGVYIVSDEVYKDLIYQRENYLLKGKHVITINSFSKTYSMCGLRVGYLFSRDYEFVQCVIDIKTHSSMNTNILGQEMALRATDVPRSYIDKQTAIWKKRRDIICSGLLSLGFDLWRPEGAFYVLPRIQNSAQVVNDLFFKYKVIVYDGSWFGSHESIRLSYALGIDQINEGLTRIGHYLKDKASWLK